jgi:nicotine blue oxidoreductase
VDVAGVVLAAGSGSRMGTPKGLLRTPDGTPWVARAVAALAAAGCRPVIVVTGAESERVRALVPPPAQALVAEAWREGMGASLRCGLSAVRDGAPGAGAVVVTLVDTPGITPAAVSRLVALAGPAALARAAYEGVPGHPVLLGREHWAGVIAAATGDAGARGYLTGRPDVTLVEAADVASGADYDTPDQLP